MLLFSASIIYENQKITLLLSSCRINGGFAFQRPSHAAIVDCSFMTGTKVNFNGEWLKASRLYESDGYICR